MVTRAQKVRLGVFLVVAALILGVLVVVIAGRQIMQKRDVYYIAYENVSVNGLNVGGQVRYKGILIGRVDEITVDPDDVSRIIVTISVQADTPIKADMKATLVPVGITGLKLIELEGGSNEADFLEPGDTIDPGVSMFDSITAKAEDIADKLEAALNNLVELTDEDNQQRVENILQSIDDIIADNKQPVHDAINGADSLVMILTRVSVKADSVVSSLQMIARSPHIYNTLANVDSMTTQLVNARVDQTIKKIDSVVERTDFVIRNLNYILDNSANDILATIESLRETMESLNEFSRQLEEDPTVLLRGKRQ